MLPSNHNSLPKANREPRQTIWRARSKQASVAHLLRKAAGLSDGYQAQQLVRVATAASAAAAALEQLAAAGTPARFPVNKTQTRNPTAGSPRFMEVL